MADPDEDEIQILEHENALSATSSNTSNNSEFRGKLISDEAELFSRQKYYKNVIFNCKLKHPEDYENVSDDEDLVTDDLPMGEYVGGRESKNLGNRRKSSFAQNSRRGSMSIKSNRTTLLGNLGNPIGNLGANNANNNENSALSANQLGFNPKDTSRVSKMIRAVGHIDISAGNYFASQTERSDSNNGNQNNQNKIIVNNNKRPKSGQKQPTIDKIVESDVEDEIDGEKPTAFALPDSAKNKRKTSKMKKEKRPDDGLIRKLSNASMGMSEMASEVDEDIDGDLAIMHVGELSKIKE